MTDTNFSGLHVSSLIPGTGLISATIPKESSYTASALATAYPNGTSTGVSVGSGDSVTITATGTWNFGTGTTNANGSTGYILPDSVVPAAAVSSLIYRIGTSGGWTLAGASVTFTAAAAGTIYLMMNDRNDSGSYADNSGSLSISIQVTSSTLVTGAIYSLTSTYGTITRLTSPSGYSPGDTLSGGIHVPFHNNPTESVVYFSGETGGSNFIKRKNADGTVTDITPTISGERQRLAYNRALHTCPMDRLTVLAATEGATTSGVFMSRDGGGSWTQISGGTTTDYTGAECAGNDRNYGYVWGKNGAIGYVDLRAQAIEDRRGNIPTDYPSAERFLRIFSL